jgi:hypothetical protein
MKTKEEREKINSKKFVEKELRKFVKQFPKFRVRYEFDGNLYLIEVSPDEIFFHSENYMKYGADICDRFDRRFSIMEFCFIVEKDLFPLKKIDFTIYGKEYASEHNLVYDEYKNFNWNRVKGLEKIFETFKERKRKHETLDSVRNS